MNGDVTRLKPVFFSLHLSRLYPVYPRSPCPGLVRAAPLWRGNPRRRALLPVLRALATAALAAISAATSRLQQEARGLSSAADGRANGSDLGRPWAPGRSDVKRSFPAGGLQRGAGGGAGGGRVRLPLPDEQKAGLGQFNGQ